MNDALFQAFFKLLNYSADSIFTGLKIVVPFVFIFKIFNFNLIQLYIDALIVAINKMMLCGAVLFLIAMGANYYHAVNSGNPMERDFMIGLLTGPHWFQLIIPVIMYALLPQVMWIRKLVNNIYSSMAIVASWFISFYLIRYFSYKDDPSLSSNNDHSRYPIVFSNEKMIVFSCLLILFYLVLFLRLKKKQN